MKRINNYINESLLDDEDELIENDDAFFTGQIKEFISNNYIGGNSPKLEIDIHKDRNGQYIVDARGEVRFISKSETSLTGGLFQWGRVGTFHVVQHPVSKITSLDGLPKEALIVQLYNCEQLTSLKGMEKSDIMRVEIYNCRNLMDLQYLPKTVAIVELTGMNIKDLSTMSHLKKLNVFRLHYMPELESLKGCPQKIDMEFNVYEAPKLTSLEGGPVKLIDKYYVTRCRSLKSLEGAPKKVRFEFGMDGNPQITSLDGLPSIGRGGTIRATETRIYKNQFPDKIKLIV